MSLSQNTPMVYIIGVMGFIGGFALGIVILNYLLKNRSRKDLLEDKSLKWTYGLFAWIIAALGAYSAVVLYGLYVSPS